MDENEEDEAQNVCNKIIGQKKERKQLTKQRDLLQQKECEINIDNFENCIPEACEKFRNEPDRHPISGQPLFVGTQLFNDVITKCDDYLNFILKTPESVRIPNKVTEFPLVNHQNFSIKPFSYRRSRIDYLLFPQRLYKDKANDVSILFLNLYLYVKHSDIMCLSFPTNLNFLTSIEDALYYEQLSKITMIWSETVNKYITKNTLYYDGSFFNYIKSCDKRFIFLMLNILQYNKGHANIILYDRKTKILERFDPYGGSLDKSWNEPLMDNAIYNLFSDNNLEISQFITPIQFCPNIGLQTLEESQTSYKYDPKGYCAAWSTLYVDARMTFPDIPPNSLIGSMIRELGGKDIRQKWYLEKIMEKYIFGVPDEYGFKSFIRNYANYLARLKYNTMKIYNTLYKKEDFNVSQLIKIMKYVMTFQNL
jgi:hypothetical protein